MAPLEPPPHEHCDRTDAHAPHDWLRWIDPTNTPMNHCCGAYPVSPECPAMAPMKGSNSG
jgi:hypothetical protein